MVKLPQRFMNDLREIVHSLISELGDEMYEIILFGSCARGTFRTGSDIDLLVVTKRAIDTHKQRGKIRDLYDDYKLDLVFYSQEIFEQSDSLFARNIKRDMILLWKEGVFLEQL